MNRRFTDYFHIMFYFILLFGFIAFCIQAVLGNDGLCYKLDFNESPKHCDNFKNDKYDPTGLKMVPVDGEDGEEKRVGLSGVLIFKVDLIEGYEIKVEALQETEHGHELVMMITANVCSSLSQDDAPWKPVIDAMNVTSCPIPVAEYPFKEMVLSLDFAKNALCHHYVGNYLISISITEKATTHACFTLGAAISEYDCDE